KALQTLDPAKDALALPSARNFIVPAKLTRCDDEILAKGEVSAVAKLEMVFEKTGPDVEEARLDPMLRHTVRDENAFLAVDKIDALVARFAIVQLDQVIPTLKT
ncbi:MAG: hypothetical protein WBC90_03180, partial [Albidovulum sp.]